MIFYFCFKIKSKFKFKKLYIYEKLNKYCFKYQNSKQINLKIKLKKMEDQVEIE